MKVSSNPITPIFLTLVSYFVLCNFTSWSCISELLWFKMDDVSSVLYWKLDRVSFHLEVIIFLYFQNTIKSFFLLIMFYDWLLVFQIKDKCQLVPVLLHYSNLE